MKLLVILLTFFYSTGMKYHELIKELSVRALYLLLLAGAITFLNYLNYEHQLEYFQGHSDLSQGSTFCSQGNGND